VEITLKRSKTDQEGRGQVKVLAYGSTLETCPVRALRAWLAHAAIETGPLFLPVDRHGNVRRRRLSGQVVARVVKQRATQAGFESVDMLAGHSLRAGFVTVARENGVPDHAIQRQTGHASTAMLARYDRPKSLWKNAASSALGL
jgi:integrase